MRAKYVKKETNKEQRGRCRHVEFYKSFRYVKENKYARVASIISKSLNRIYEGQDLDGVFVFKDEYVMHGGYLYRVGISKYHHRIPARMLKNEINTLAILEAKDDYIFNERKKFLPLDLVNRIYKTSYSSYRDAAHDNLMCIPEGIPKDTCDEWYFLYAKAGVYYATRNKLAFSHLDYQGLNGHEALDKASFDIMKLNDEKSLEAYITGTYTKLLNKAQEIMKSKQTKKSSAFI